MFKLIKKKYIIKIPENFQVIYCNTKNIIVFLKNNQKQVLNLKVKIVLIPNKNLIAVKTKKHGGGRIRVRDMPMTINKR